MKVGGLSPNFIFMPLQDVDILEYLFGSKVASRLLKFLFRHPQEAFRVGEIARLIDSNYNTSHSYIKKFERIGLIKVTRPLGVQPPLREPFGPSQTAEKKEEEEAAKLYILNPEFRLFEELKTLINKASPIAEAAVVNELNQLGKVRLAMLSGIFVGKDTMPVDLFVVADDVVEQNFKAFVQELEADVGRPIRYTLMDTNEFTYRFNIYDRFVRNILKFPHQKIIDTLSVSAAKM